MDFLELLFEDLRSPDPALRFTVLSRVETADWTPEDLARFRSYAESEKDSSSRFHMNLIIQLVERKISGASLSRNKLADIEKILGSPEIDFFQLILNLKNIEDADLPLSVGVLRKRGLTDFPEEVVPFILGIFRQYGSREDVPVIEDFCRHSNPRILTAAVEALERINPEDLKAFIVPLLVNTSTTIQFQAVRILYRWDQTEALRHFESMLFSDEIQVRQTALIHAFLFPFSQIEPLLLRLLSLDEDPSSIEKAGKLFIINPSEASALSLIDIFETSSGQKKEAVKTILLGVVDFLSKAGLIKKTPREILIDLRDKYKQKKALLFLGKCRLLLGQNDTSQRKVAIVRLGELHRGGFTPAKDLLEAHLPKEADPENLRILRRELQPQKGTKDTKIDDSEPLQPQKGTKGTKIEDSEQLGSESRGESPGSDSGTIESELSKLETGTIEDFRKVKQVLVHGFEKASLDAKISVINTICRFEGKEAVPFVQKCLKSKDDEILRTALEALSRIDPDLFLPFALNFLQHPSIDIQIAILRALAIVKKKQALSIVEQYVFSVQAARRKAGIFSLSSFDFPTVQELVFKILQKEEDPDNLVQIAEILKSNASEDLVFQLYSSMRASPAKARDTIGKIFLQGSEEVARNCPSKFPSSDALLKDFQARYEAGKRRQGTASSAYSLEKIQRMRTPGKPAGTAERVQQAPKASSPEKRKSQEVVEFSSPDPLEWYYGLLKISVEEWSMSDREEMQRLAKVQTDVLTRFHMDLLLRQFEKSKSPLSPEPPLLELENFLKSNPIPFPGVAEILSGLSRRDGPLALPLLREACWESFPNEVMPFLFNFFKRYGKCEDGKSIEPFCRSSDPRIVVTAVEALEKINPEDLKPLLVDLLVNPHPGVRTLAVRLLYKWDETEALRHFEATLFSEDQLERHSSLYHAYFLPFLSIEPFLMRFLGMESDPELIKKAGFLFRVNPHPDEPMKLTEIWETSSGEKKQLIGQILTGVVEALSKAGLLKKSPKEILDELKERYRKRRIFQMIEQCRSALESESPEQRWGAFHRLESLFQSGIYQTSLALSDHFPKETDADLKKKIGIFLGNIKKRKVVQEVAPEQLELTERINWLGSLSEEMFRKHRKNFEKILETASGDELLLIIHSFERFGEKADATILRKFLKDASPRIMAATIEAFRTLDFETLIPLLPKFVQMPEEDVRAAAVKAYVFYDKKQALSYVEQILGSPKPSVRGAGIFALGYFDFPAVKELSLSLFEKETDSDNLKLIELILKENLSHGFLVQIAGIVEHFPESKASLGSRFLLECAEILFLNDPQYFDCAKGILEVAQNRLKADSEQKKAPPPIYALQNIQRIRKEKGIAAKSEWVSDSMFPAIQSVSPKIALCGILLIFLWYIFPFSGENSIPGVSVSTEKPSTGKAVSPREAPLVTGETREIQGGVNSAFADGISVTLDANKEILFIRFSQPPRPFKAGDAFRGKIKVTKKGSGRTEGELLKLY